MKVFFKNFLKKGSTMTLIKGKIYSSKDLFKTFGGNIQSSMPFVNKKVPYCKFSKKINPQFPDEAWIEIGPMRKKGVEYLTNCKSSIPVFEKVKTNSWKYLGKASISEISDKNRIKIINDKPPRQKIQSIIKFNFK